MKNLANIFKGLSLPTAAVIIIVGMLVFTNECDRKESCPPEGFILVTEGFIDTLQMIANAVPDTIRDTIRIKSDIVYIDNPVPVPVSIDPEINFYTDSIVNDSINVWSEITVKGFINKWDWRYRPIIHRFETTIKKPVPMPVPYGVPVSKAGLYGSFGMGGNRSTFMSSGSLDYINKKDNLYGFQYLRFNQKSFYMFRIGKKIKFKR